MRRLYAEVLLFVASIIWGSAFIAQAWANESMAPMTFVGLRFLISSLPLLPLALVENKRAGQRLSDRGWKLAMIVGLAVWIGATLQQVGLKSTTVTNGGFLTSLYVVLVPWVTWAVLKNRPTRVHIIGSLLSVLGVFFLAKLDFGRGFSRGDVLMLLSDFAWAFAIVLVTMFLREAQRPLLLSFIQYLVVGVLGIVSGLVFENVYLHEIGKTLPFLLYAGLVSGAIAYTLQVVAQAHIPPSEAAVIMSLESVVAAICGYFALGETLTVLQLVGCLVILISVVFVEVGPTLFKTRYPTSD